MIRRVWDRCEGFREGELRKIGRRALARHAATERRGTKVRAYETTMPLLGFIFAIRVVSPDQ